ncbi:MAG: dihydrolipoyl dehydrogenase [Sulfuricurvum sp.]|jgi:dihydrolipoamide dehydrogenase
MNHYDVIIIGAGPGGYESAIQLGKAGLKTLLIDKTKERIGGTCLNEGCISTKNYLESAGYASKAPYFLECGLDLQIKGLDLARLRERTVSLKDELRSGVVWQLDQAGVEMVYGFASFVDEHTLDVSGEAISFDKCIIATGAKVREAPVLPLDGKQIVSSSDLFELDTLPKSIAIVGGGPIGCEFATFFSAFGVDVTLIARGSQLLSTEDEDVAKALLRAFKKNGIKVITSSAVQKVEVTMQGVELDVVGEIEEKIKCELVLCAIGRDPNIEELRLENANVQRDDKKFITVTGTFQTTQKNIYAIGDCINTPAYAHTAYAEAKIAAVNIINDGDAVNTHVTPSTIFTVPQVASCGLSEKEAKEQGIAIEVKKAFFKVNAKAKIIGDDSGFVKILICPERGTILGASIIGVEATEVIHELLIAVEKKLTASELTSTIHVHPSVSEIIRYL